MVQIRQCNLETCLFRFPAPDNSPDESLCPKCGATTHIAAIVGPSPKVQSSTARLPGIPVEILLDNIRSAFNVGSMFRAADGAGIGRLHLCGITTTPDNPKLWKTSLGAELSVPWTYRPNGLIAARHLKQQGMRLWALEGGPGSVSILDAVHEVNETPLALVVGNEISGVDPEILGECDCIVHIPMLGYKRSLNVATAFGIAAYFLRFVPSYAKSPIRTGQIDEMAFHR